MPRRRSISTDKRVYLETLARGLLELEMLSGDEIKDLLLGKRRVRQLRDRADSPTLLRGTAQPSKQCSRPQPSARRGCSQPQGTSHKPQTLALTPGPRAGHLRFRALPSALILQVVVAQATRLEPWGCLDSSR